MIGKLVFYFLGINGTIALTTFLVTATSPSKSKEFSNQSELKILSLESDDSKIWDWGKFKKGLILLQKVGQWTLKVVNAEEDYKKWKSEEKAKKPGEYKKESAEIVYALFPVSDKVNFSNFLNGLAPNQAYSKYLLKAELEDKSEKFKKNLGSENYHRLMAFIEKFGSQ